MSKGYLLLPRYVSVKKRFGFGFGMKYPSSWASSCSFVGPLSKRVSWLDHFLRAFPYFESLSKSDSLFGSLSKSAPLFWITDKECSPVWTTDYERPLFDLLTER